jgi:hypothetical protein
MPRTYYPPFPLISKEEEEAHREAERKAEHEEEREVERMMRHRYERPQGSGKAPMEPEATFMQVLSNLVVSQQAMTRSLAKMADRLATGSTSGTQAPHTAQGNSGAGNKPHSATRAYTSSSRIHMPLFPSF